MSAWKIGRKNEEKPVMRKEKKKDASGKGHFSSREGRVRMSLPYPRTSLDMAANLMPPKLSKRREAIASIRKGIMTACAIIAFIIAILFGVRSLHLVDELNIPLLSNNTTSETTPSVASTTGAAASEPSGALK